MSWSGGTRLLRIQRPPCRFRLSACASFIGRTEAANEKAAACHRPTTPPCTVPTHPSRKGRLPTSDRVLRRVQSLPPAWQGDEGRLAASMEDPHLFPLCARCSRSTACEFRLP